MIAGSARTADILTDALRSQALKVLAENPSLVNTNFIIRDQLVFLNTQDIELRQKFPRQIDRNQFLNWYKAKTQRRKVNFSTLCFGLR